MTRRRMFMQKMGNSTVMFSADDRSIPSLNVVSFADNSSISNENGNFDGPFNYNMKFNPTTAIIILVLFSFFIGMAFYTFCIRRRLTTWDNTTAFRVAGFDHGSTAQAAQGLERSVIESFPVFSYNVVKGLKSQAKGSECAVCLTDFEDHDMLRLLPKCSHAFHPECIDTWLCTNTTCPLCRTTLLSSAHSTATSTDFGIAEPQLSHEQLTVVADNGGGVSRQGNDFPEAMIGGESYDSTGHSLIMVQSELKQGNDWYIVTADGLTPGLYSSFAGTHQPSGSLAPPPYSKPGGSAESRSKSERWGNISINPASFLRTFSMRVTGGDRDEVAGEQQDEKPYLSWLKGRNRDGEADGSERSQGGSGSSRHADKSAAQL